MAPTCSGPGEEAAERPQPVRPAARAAPVARKERRESGASRAWAPGPPDRATLRVLTTSWRRGGGRARDTSRRGERGRGHPVPAVATALLRALRPPDRHRPRTVTFRARCPGPAVHHPAPAYCVACTG